MVRRHVRGVAVAALGAGLLAVPPVLALALRHRVPSAGTATPAPAPQPPPPARESAFVLGREIGPLAAGIRAEPRPSAIAVTATLLGPAGRASGYHALLTLVSSSGSATDAARPCGPGCYSTVLPERGTPRAIRLTVAGRGAHGTAVFALPDQWPPVNAEQLLLRATRTFRSLRSVVTDQRLASSPNDVIQTRYLEVAPDRFSYEIEGGPQAVVIGRERWDRDTPSGRWQRTAAEPIPTPFLEWSGEPQDVTLIASRRVAAKAVWLVSFAVTRDSTPIWFTVAIDKATDRLLDLEMTTTAHFMHDRYSDFDAPLRVEPPGATPPIPTPIGAGPAYHPSLGSHPVAGLRCSSAPADRFGVHLEVFANRRVVLIPPGIGIVRSTGCSDPARTREPTGVIEVASGTRPTLGEFFSIWGEPLSSRQLLGFSASPGASVLAFVGGRRWRGDPRAIPLTRHAEIVLEIGGYVPPHVSYRFPPGL